MWIIWNSLEIAWGITKMFETNKEPVEVLPNKWNRIQIDRTECVYRKMYEKLLKNSWIP